VEDCWAAFGWAARRAEALGGDPRRLALCGDSAGGNLSTVVARRARDAGGVRPRLQALIYPGLDFTCAAPSHRRLGEGYFLTRRMIDGFRSHYVPRGQDLRHPELSPLFVRDPGGLPPALVVTAGFDPLRDEGSEYVRRLREAGVQVEHHHHPGLIHGFLHLTGVVERARAALERTAAAIGDHLATGAS
jgi:acetyl esterase